MRTAFRPLNETNQTTIMYFNDERDVKINKNAFKTLWFQRHGLGECCFIVCSPD